MTDQEIAELVTRLRRLVAAEARYPRLITPVDISKAADTIDSLLTSLKEARAEVERVREGLRTIIGEIDSKCDASNWDSGSLPDGTRYKGDAFAAVLEVYENFKELSDDYRSLLKDLPHAG